MSKRNGKPKQDDEVVYLLIDPRDNIVRYVGTSTAVRIRVYGHLSSCARRGTRAYVTRKNKWLRELKKLGLRPIVEIAYSVGIHLLAMKLERLMQWKHRDTIYNDNLPGYDQTIDPILSQALAYCLMVELSAAAKGMKGAFFWNHEDSDEYIRETGHHLLETADLYQRHLCALNGKEIEETEAA